jgi:hypothetical protein
MYEVKETACYQKIPGAADALLSSSGGHIVRVIVGSRSLR